MQHRRVHGVAGRVVKQVVLRGLEVTSSLQDTFWLKQSLTGLPQLLFLLPFSIWLTLFKSALVVSPSPPRWLARSPFLSELEPAANPISTPFKMYSPPSSLVPTTVLSHPDCCSRLLTGLSAPALQFILHKQPGTS